MKYPKIEKEHPVLIDLRLKGEAFIRKNKKKLKEIMKKIGCDD